jgi:TolA-binding protein
MDKALYWAGVTERRLGREEDARVLFERLRRDYPESAFLRKIPKLAAPPPAATATAVL